MNEKEEILNTLREVIGEDECCGVSCDWENAILKDEEGWKLYLEGFMDHWFIGKTVDEAKESIKKYSSQGFGLS